MAFNKEEFVKSLEAKNPTAEPLKPPEVADALQVDEPPAEEKAVSEATATHKEKS